MFSPPPPRQADPSVQWFLNMSADMITVMTLVKDAEIYTPGCIFLSYDKERQVLGEVNSSPWAIVFIMSSGSFDAADTLLATQAMSASSTPVILAFSNGQPIPSPEVDEARVRRMLVLASAGQIASFNEAEVQWLLREVGNGVPRSLIQSLPR